MKVFEFIDYREFIQSYIRGLPKEGRGELLKMAQAANIHPSTLSQVLQGTRHFTSEQTMAVAEYLNFSDNESKYLLLLVQYERAGSAKLRSLLKSQIDQLRSDVNRVVKHVPSEVVLSFEEKAIFYSNWYYSASRLLTSIPGYQSVDHIAEYLKLPRTKVVEIMNFLLSRGLCIEENGNLKMGPQSTHIDLLSPLVSRHHANWRLKAMERHPSISPTDDFAFTSPMTVSKESSKRILEELIQVTRRSCDYVDSDERPSELYCMNVDWFKV